MYTPHPVLDTTKYYSVAMILIMLICLFNSANAKETGQNTMSPHSTCQQTPLKKSQEVIRFILSDLTESYTEVGGGGISSIKQLATNTYMVSISQEERIDQITYELEINKDCDIKILNRKVSAISQGR